jgi:putative transposase
MKAFCVPDHVHLLLSVNPKVAPSVLANNFKSLVAVGTHPAFWSRSYCVVSCGGAPLPVLKQYVQYVEGQAGVESGIA